MASNFCCFLKAGGEPCHAQRLAGSDFCFAHDPDPKIASAREAARRAGGHARHQKAVLDLNSAPNVPLRRYADILYFIENTVHQIRRGELHDSIGRVIIALCKLQIQVLPLAHKEARGVLNGHPELILPYQKPGKDKDQSPEAEAFAAAMEMVREALRKEEEEKEQERQRQAELAERERASAGIKIKFVLVEDDEDDDTGDDASDQETSRDKQTLADEELAEVESTMQDEEEKEAPTAALSNPTLAPKNTGAKMGHPELVVKEEDAELVVEPTGEMPAQAGLADSQLTEIAAPSADQLETKEETRNDDAEQEVSCDKQTQAAPRLNWQELNKLSEEELARRGFTRFEVYTNLGREEQEERQRRASIHPQSTNSKHTWPFTQ